MIKATERILRFFLTAVGMAGFCLFLLPQTAGCTPRVVISGSMEPAVPVGSIVYTNRWIKQENIKEGDIIAYGLSGGVSVLHRVVETDKNSRIWRTKGDANEVSDPGAVSYEQYLGKMIFSLPYVGYLISVFKRPPPSPDLPSALPSEYLRRSGSCPALSHQWPAAGAHFLFRISYCADPPEPLP